MQLYAFIGKVVYGGIYWGKLKYWNDGNSAADHIWLIALLQWIFGIVGLAIPFVSFILVCMIIHSTRSSNCNSFHIQFPEDVQIKIINKYDNFPTQDYFKSRCSLPHKLFITFLVFDLLSSASIILKAVEYLKAKKEKKDEDEDGVDVEDKESDLNQQ